MSQDSLLIGLRAYLTGDNDSELEMQASDARKFFPDSFLLISLCGKPPTGKATDMADEVQHYSKKPLGLTPPFRMIADFAREKGFSKCILTDGDEQHMFSEIKRIFDPDSPSVVIPVRENRSLFFSDDAAIDRLTLEEAENAFLRLRYGCMLADPQPGLVILPGRKAIMAAGLSGVASMIGDLALATRLFLAGFRIEEPAIRIRAQKKTRVSLALEFEKISQLESYYSLGFSSVVSKCIGSPEKYLPRGNARHLAAIREKFLEWEASRGRGRDNI